MASDIEIGENFQAQISPSSNDGIIFKFEEKEYAKNALTSGKRKKLNNQVNLTNLWNRISFRNTFNKMACLGFFLSLLNIGTDYFSSYSFIHGSNYTKTVDDVNNKAVTKFPCTHVETNLKFDNLTENVKLTYTFNCFEQDIIWGYITLAIITGKFKCIRLFLFIVI